MSEPIGRFSAVHTIGRGLEEAPVLRQGLGVTWLLAAVGAGGRVVVPILLQQAIDRGISPRPVRSVSGSSPCWLPSPRSRSIVSGIAQRQAIVRLGRRSEQALYDLRVRLIAHIHRISLADHNEERRGALVARVTSDIETLAQFFQWGGLAWLLDGTLMLMVGGRDARLRLGARRGRVRRRCAAGVRAARRCSATWCARTSRPAERNGEMMSAITEVVSGAETIRAYDAGAEYGEQAERRRRPAGRARRSRPASSAPSCSRPARCSRC